MVCCQARVSSTLARPLPSVVITSVGQTILGTSARMSTHAIRGPDSSCRIDCTPLSSPAWFAARSITTRSLTLSE